MLYFSITIGKINKFVLKKIFDAGSASEEGYFGLSELLVIRTYLITKRSRLNLLGGRGGEGLACVGGMLPPTLEPPPLSQVAIESETSSALLLELFSLPRDQKFQLRPCHGSVCSAPPCNNHVCDLRVTTR